MIKIFETLKIVEETNSTEEKEDDYDDYFDLGWSISPKCRKYCKKKSSDPENFTDPTRCPLLPRKRK